MIVLDLEMPRMDGLTFLRKIMAEDPIPVVVCSGLAGPGTEAALRALEEGAVDVIAKPKLGGARLPRGVRQCCSSTPCAAPRRAARARASAVDGGRGSARSPLPPPRPRPPCA